MPRQVVAIFTVLPLTMFADVSSPSRRATSWAITWLNTPGSLYWSALNSLVMKDLAIGLIKPFFFGYLIATIACFFGMNTEGGADRVGDAATKAVVYASLES